MYIRFVKSEGMANQMTTNSIHLLYCKHYDVRHLRGDITFQICSAVNRLVPCQALGAQQLKGVWLIAVKSAEAKSSLLRRSISIGDQDITVYPNNPYTSRGFDGATERIVIKGIPLGESNAAIYEYIKSVPQLTLTNDNVYDSKARNNSNGTSSFINGDRYFYVKSDIDPPLPEQVKIGEHLCRTWYASRDRKCKRCGEGHHTNDVDRCDSYTTPLEHVKVFSTGPFSNFNRCTIDMGPLTFITSEHAYQFRACEEHLRADLAEKVLKSRTPHDAKIIAASIKDSDPYSEWNLKKVDIMREVLNAKINSSEEFRKELIESADKLLVEASATDKFWGSGLTYNLTLTTLPDQFPGKNMLGKLLVELRNELKKKGDKVPMTESVKEPTAPASDVTNIVEMPKRETRPKLKSSAKQRDTSISGKTARRKDIPLIRDMFKKESKRKRVTSPPQSSFQACDSDDDTTSMSSYGSFVESSSNRTSEFVDEESVDNR